MHSTEQELIQLEHQYWDAMKANDAKAAVRLTGFPCVISGSHGVGTIDQAAYEKIMREKKSKIRDFSFNDMHVSFANDDTAIVSYEITQDLEMDGKDLKLASADCSTWVRAQGQWKCVSHSEAKLDTPA